LVLFTARISGFSAMSSSGFDILFGCVSATESLWMSTSRNLVYAGNFYFSQSSAIVLIDKFASAVFFTNFRYGFFVFRFCDLLKRLCLNTSVVMIAGSCTLLLWKLGWISAAAGYYGLAVPILPIYVFSADLAVKTLTFSFSCDLQFCENYLLFL